jgi:hypothetical protein
MRKPMTESKQTRNGKKNGPLATAICTLASLAHFPCTVHPLARLCGLAAVKSHGRKLSGNATRE